MKKPYGPKDKLNAIQKIRQCAGKGMDDCNNPGITKRDAIAIADYIVSLETINQRLMAESSEGSEYV